MKARKYKIPLYHGELIIIQTDDLKKVEKKYRLQDLTGFDACAFRDTSNPEFSKYVMAFKSVNPEIIAHECLHFVGYVFEDRNMIMDISNDEPQCYLLEWAFKMCHNHLKRRENI